MHQMMGCKMKKKVNKPPCLLTKLALIMVSVFTDTFKSILNLIQQFKMQYFSILEVGRVRV